MIFCCKTRGLGQILEIGGLIHWQTKLACLMNTSGSNGIFDGFEIFLMRMQQTKQKFLHDKICPLTFSEQFQFFPLVWKGLFLILQQNLYFVLFLFQHLTVLNLNRLVRQIFFLSFKQCMVSVSTVVSLNFNTDRLYFVDTLLILEFL